MSGWLGRMMFEAPWWGVVLNPHFLPRRALWRAMRSASGELRGRILDVGCGVQPYRELMTNAESITGLELDTEENRSEKNADAFYDGKTLPFANESFESVLCNQVLEHVFAPEQFVAEMQRVLRPDGILVLSVPFVWPEHEQPRDSQRYSSFGLRDLLLRNGFAVLAHDKLVPGAAALFAIAAAGADGTARRWPLPLRLAIRLICVFPLSLCGALVAGLGRRDAALYLDNFVVARKSASLRGGAA